MDPSTAAAPAAPEALPAKPAVTAVVYARDAEATIAGAIERLSRALAGVSGTFEVIVIDDGSADGTPAVVAAAAGGRPDLRLLRRTGAPGYGSCLRQAVAAAAHPLLLVLDAEDRLDLSAVGALVSEAEACDIVFGRRVGERGPWRRRLRRGLFRLFCRVVFGIPVADATCPLKLYRRSVFDRVQVQSDGWFADAEVLAKAGFFGLVIGETAVQVRDEAGAAACCAPGTGRQILREAWALIRRPSLAPPG